MAGIDFDDFQEQTGPDYGRSVQGLVSWAGALTSVALVAGLTIWGYKLTMRDVSGVPVVRALEGPMRVTPEDPGGRKAAHQGLAVNSVAADGEAEAPADRLLLAPRPIDLTDEDAPLAVLREATLEEAEPQEPEKLQMASVTNPVATADPIAAALAIANSVSEGQEPFAETAKIEEPAATADPEPTGPKIVSASVPGVSRSLRPARRPAGDLAARAALAAAAAKAAPAQAKDITVTSVSAGTNLVQLGAFDSEDVAHSEWQRLSSRFSSFMNGKQRLVQKAVSGGRTFYRLRAVGFNDIADARRFCAALTAENADCIPVVAR
ncbi:SPOR domain-containing protein [Actibacterium lipolyticum]|uniref:Sporulation related domain protein n=1 Tax=Actibacterium lipolyticum TaxID=1524263 RepID=A0A238KG38_9RHOB|nr:SPOR domain-containing protein [Actibacterium lipolyticum]SMX41793.1 Sporulation related domain protein [Actibacterium lipolyticum]